MVDRQPQHVVVNGYVNHYNVQPLTARPDELVRVYVVDAGPDNWSAFHVVGTLFSTVAAEGTADGAMHRVETASIPPGGAAMMEFSIPQAGMCPFVTHSFGAVRSAPSGDRDQRTGGGISPGRGRAASS